MNATSWTKTASWTEHGGYATTRPDAVLCERLDPYRMTPEKWSLKVTETPEGERRMIVSIERAAQNEPRG